MIPVAFKLKDYIQAKEKDGKDLDTTLYLDPAPYPSTILWANRNAPKCASWFDRNRCATFIILIMFSFGFVMNQKLERYIIQTKYALDPPNVDCESIVSSYNTEQLAHMEASSVVQAEPLFATPLAQVHVFADVVEDG